MTITTENHNTYGGYIFKSDFCTDFPRIDKFSSWAERIAEDFKFDEQCKKNVETRMKKGEI